ncbi:ZIP-like zinc transporter proteins [Phaffia rhodozyma]|uniref:ZIP-like zinc transporter proteins n=1 Tax=Phaffia rhodozyma TaxID=264483 RepID=A0A0F7SGK1_PHARH|nr:ZIP-like zinc transporter proteins [Phaffia rhodozyma]
MSNSSSSESLNTQILHIKGSVECSHPACHLHDFLPIKLPISTNPGEDPNVRMDVHMGSKECSENILQKGRAEKEIIRSRKERGELCFNKGCKKTVQGGLGVKCEAAQKLPSNTRSILGGPSREAALAAIKRANLSGKTSSKPSSTPKPVIVQKPDPKPLSSKEKDVNPNEQKTKIKPITNPLSATSRHTKAESSSRRQALANRARLGILNEEEKLMWAEMVGQEERDRRKSGGKSKEKGCVSLAMGISSFLVGLVPMLLGKRLRFLSVYGMGLLVGAALSVVIPEGVSTIYDATSLVSATVGDHDGDDTVEGQSQVIGMSLLGGFILMMIVEKVSHSLTTRSAQNSHAYTPVPPNVPEDDRFDEEVDEALMSQASSSPRRLSGTAVLGGPSLGGSGSTGNEKSGLVRLVMRDHPKSFSATLALVIHSLADGVALGASARSSQAGSGLGLVIFAAIFVHKIPASVGLCTTLLSDHLPRPLIRTCIALFASAAPLGAFLTYTLVTQISKGEDDVASLTYWTGVLLLISGGTFLYVATVIQDLSHGHSHETFQAEGQTQTGTGAGDDGNLSNPGTEELGSMAALATIVFGMVTPLLLSQMRE